MPSRYQFQLHRPDTGETSPLFDALSFDDAERLAFIAALNALDDGVELESRIFVDGRLHHEHCAPRRMGNWN